MILNERELEILNVRELKTGIDHRHIAVDKCPPHGYQIVDFASLPGIACPCGTARRAFADAADFPATIHVTEISSDARTHYHRRITEVYYFLQCDADAGMQLDDESIPVQPGMAILIRPGTRHRALGRMKVLIVAIPKFDPHDEFED